MLEITMEEEDEEDEKSIHERVQGRDHPVTGDWGEIENRNSKEPRD